MEIETHPFEPFLPAHARLLMLGTFPPAPKRWCMPWYYPNYTNDMWRIFGLHFFGDKLHFVDEAHKTFRLPTSRPSWPRREWPSSTQPCAYAAPRAQRPTKTWMWWKRPTSTVCSAPCPVARLCSPPASWPPTSLPTITTSPAGQRWEPMCPSRSRGAHCGSTGSPAAAAPIP